MSEPAIPVWGSVALDLITPIVASFTFVVGRATKSGVDSQTLKNLCEDFSVTQKLVNELVVTVSNHGQSISTINTQMTNLAKSMSNVEQGIATLVERTKKL